MCGTTTIGMKRTRAGRAVKAMFFIVALGWAFATVAAAPTISVSAKQRYPWNGLVDLSFTLTGTGGVLHDTSFTARDVAGGTNITMATVRKTDGTAANVAQERLMPGAYSWVWDAAADLPKGWKCDRVTVTGTAVVSSFSYSVKFNANGGSGTMSNEAFTYGTAKALTANAFTRTGYTFQGWATSASGSKVYNDKQSVNNLTTTSGAVVNLYAVWARSKVQLWSGGPYWAAMNIGADKPSDYGYYFWWGDTVGYKRVNNAWVASDGSSSGFPRSVPTESQYHTTLRNNGWTTADDVLAPEHDAAQVQWGGGWRMPTFAEQKNLIDKCDWTWTTKNGIQGYVVQGKGSYASASIFLPAAGRATGLVLPGYSEYPDAGSCGYYWSSVPNRDGYTTLGYDTSCRLSFSSSSHSYSTAGYTDNNQYNCDGRGAGFSIRPVQSAK